jgi:hypothetical protein
MADEHKTTDRHGLYLTVGHDDQGRLLAICTDGTPQRGHASVTILSVEVVADLSEATDWFACVKRKRPWEARQ